MIGIFSVFDVMESYGDFMEEIYNSSVYKITWMLVVTFPALHIYFIYIYIYIYQTCIFCISYEMHFETTVNYLL
jgi:hypothetical protein